jgi:nitrite reductase (NADH) large subunit
VTFVAGIAALVLWLITLLSPPIGLATATSADFHIEQLWRNGQLKQVTGYSLLAALLVAGAVSMRKRWSFIRFGQFASWRAFHGVVGVLCLVGLAAHTGFRLGHNLDRWLASCFLLSTGVGAGAGILVAIEPRHHSPRVVALRQLLARLHLWLLWPLPVLITAHVIKVYFF